MNSEFEVTIAFLQVPLPHPGPIQASQSGFPEAAGRRAPGSGAADSVAAADRGEGREHRSRDEPSDRPAGGKDADLLGQHRGDGPGLLVVAGEGKGHFHWLPKDSSGNGGADRPGPGKGLTSLLSLLKLLSLIHEPPAAPRSRLHPHRPFPLLPSPPPPLLSESLLPSSSPNQLPPHE